MILLPEIEILAKRIFRKHPASVHQINRTTIRIELSNNSFIDIFQSVKDPARFALHVSLSNGRIFRLDPRPERKYLKLPTFPWHFHKEREENVVASPFSSNKRIAITQFFRFVKEKLEV